MSAGARKQKTSQDKVPMAPSEVEAKDVGDDEESESSTVQAAMALLKGAIICDVMFVYVGRSKEAEKIPRQSTFWLHRE